MAKELNSFPQQIRRTVKRGLAVNTVYRNIKTGKEVKIRNIYRKQQRVLVKPNIGDSFMLSFDELKTEWSKV